MKLFVAIVMFVLAPSGIEWQPVEKWPPLVKQDYPRADVAEPHVDARGEQQQPGYVPPSLNTQPQPTTSQPDSSQAGKTEAKDVDPEGKLSVSDQIQQRLADLTLWLVVLTVVQAVILGFQASYGVQAANAARASAQVAREALEVVERPSLSVESWDFEPRNNASPYPTGLICTLRNTGRTPATLRGGAVDLMGSEATPPHVFVHNTDTTQQGLFTVHAQAAWEYVLSFSVEQWRDAKRTEGARGRTYLYGHIDYTDEFGSGYRLWFCIFESPRLMPVREGGYNYTEKIEKQEEKRPWYSFLFGRNTK